MRRITAEQSQWRLQTCTGKNLLNPAGAGLITYYNSSGTASSRYGVLISDSGTYTCRAFKPAPTTRNVYIYAAVLDENNNQVSATKYIVINQTVYEQTLTVLDGQKLFIYSAISGGSASKYELDIVDCWVHLEEGDTVTEFEPYCGGACHLSFERCKGGYFSSIEDYALKVIGRQAQEDASAPIQCVKAGTKVIVLGKNLFNKDTVTQGAYLSVAGTVVSSGAWSYSDYIAVKPDTKYTLHSSSIGNAPATCFYTANKTFISGVRHDNQNPKVFATPANAAFVRVSVYINSLSNAQFEEGETATPYAAYDANSVTLPCDLYDGDVWYPMSGKAELQSIPLTTTTAWINTNNQLAFSPDSFSARFEVEPNTQYELYLDTDAASLFRAGATSSEVLPVLGAPIALSSVTRTNAPSHITLNTGASSKYIWVQVSAGQSQAIYSLTAINKATGEARQMCVTTEQYDPQPIFAPAGTVQMVQDVVELAAGLSATMLVRR